ncbi:MAG: CDP-archaeol synthase [Bdellovibrionaceae bacterium]|nr:CDP-archaeol synthase [Pseudobdellovibrionaceae bacterium]
MTGVLLLILPLFISASLHMAIVKWDLLAFAKKPLSQPLFGRNKTWRGFLVMPPLTLLGVEIAHRLTLLWFADWAWLWPENPVDRWFLGLMLGLAYVLFELPNSWFKRRRGIAEGARAERNAWIFIVIDQGDSALGCALCYALLWPETAPYVPMLVLIGPAVHLFGNYLLFKLKLRKEPV